MVPLAIEWAWPETPASIAITIVAAVAGRWLLLRAIKRGSELAVSRANQRRVDQGGDNAELYAARHAARAATMGSLLRSVTNVTIAVLTVLTVMAILNIPLTPILASAGVGGVALGFGADDIDGTVHKETILHDAGATSPEALSEDRIIRIIREAGRVPAPCDCNYHILRRLEGPTFACAPAAAAQTVH